MPSGILTETVTIETNKAQASNWEGQILRLSMAKRLVHKLSSNIVTQIRAKYKPEIDAIRNKIASLDSQRTTNEYTVLMSELNDLNAEQDQQIEQAEQEASDKEEDLQLQIDGLETRLEAIKKDTETLEETRSDNIQNAFNYFQT